MHVLYESESGAHIVLLLWCRKYIPRLDSFMNHNLCFNLLSRIIMSSCVPEVIYGSRSKNWITAQYMCGSTGGMVDHEDLIHSPTVVLL